MSHEETPIEILCEIFGLLCEESIAIHVLDKRSRFNGFPWAAGQVCRRWREAFLSYPRLWTSLSLKYTYIWCYDADPHGFAEMNRRTILYLERSGQLPLTITVYILAHMRTAKIKHFPRAVWKSLLSCSDRWKKAQVVLGNEPGMVNDLLECRNQISKLESMDLYIDPIITECKPQDSAFVVAPRLTELKLLPHSRWVFPWSQLKKLHIEIDNAEAILSQVQNVEELWITHCVRLTLPNFNPSSAIRLPHLRFFEVPVVCYHRIFDWFEMPLLEHLCVYDRMKSFHFPEQWKAEIASSINRSACRIRCLTLKFCRGEVVHDITETLAASIERLCIKHPFRKTVPPLIQLIADSNGVYLPNLQELEVICCPGQAVSKGFLPTIFHLLKAQLALTGHGVAPLKSVTVRLDLSDSCNDDAFCYMDHELNDERRIKILDKVVEMMRSWSSVADISFGETHSQISIKPYSW